MNRILILSGLLLAYSTAVVGGETEGRQLSSEEKAYILSRFCTEVKYNFAFYDKLQFDWDSICHAAMPELAATTSDEDFVKGMQALCAKLKDGHTYVFSMNNPADPKDWIRPLPMQTKRVGDHVFVTGVYSTSLQNSGVMPGCEILEIDGEDVLSYAKKHIEPFLASSTPQWSDYGPFAEYELTKEAGSKESKYLFRDRKGKEFTITTNRLIPWDINPNTTMMDFHVQKGNIGVLTVRSFQNSDFDRSRFDELYKDILKTDALVIDMRDNGGGNSAHADYLMSHFCDQPIRQGRWRSPQYIAAHGSWNYPKEWYTETPDPILPNEGKDIYMKPMALLVNATTFSSAENFCVSFKGAHRGKIIGMPTAGSTGNPIIIDLGGGIGCGICTKDEADTEGNEFIGIGIQPDILVEDDADAYLKDEDKILATALDVLKKELRQRR